MKNYVAKYFLNTKKVAKNFCKNDDVTLQFFQWENNVMLCGINEVLEFLNENTNTSKYQIKYLPEKTMIKSREVVLELKGHYQDFAMYEGVIDGILSRASSLATNAQAIKKAANGKNLIFMGDRADYYLNQPRDGYAVAMGGIETQVTKAQVSLHNGQAVGTMPHALIQLFHGDLIKAMHKFREIFPEQNLIALVDFNNDVIVDALLALKEFKHELYGVRVDTSRNLVDKYFIDKEVVEKGVNVTLIKALRAALNKNGGKHVKIIVSSGFNAKKIAQFEAEKAPVDFYGVGAAVMKIKHFFSADAVKINGELVAKVGRKYQNNKKLKIY